MEQIDYNKLGLRCGLELHQQLTGKKLFCNCNTDLREENLEAEVKRKLRGVAGETGEVDVAALYEQAKDRTFVYHGYKGEYCLVDLDCEPPHAINKDAIKTALEVSKLLKLNIPDTLVVMRKIISDGSAVSSFQRSVLVGYESKDSYLETKHGKVKIASLMLEEDACKIEKVHGKEVFYSLSRQGIPLIEVSTCADIRNPEHAREVAETLGLMLRSFPNVKRGIGTIRQDVNLSIRDGARVELKGFQDIRTITKVIDMEIIRQFNIINTKKKVKEEVRKVNQDGTTSFLRPIPGAARLYPDTDLEIIKIGKNILREIKIPELITEKIIKLEKEYNLGYDLAKQLVDNEYFLDLISKFKKIDPGFIARALIEMPKEIKARYNLVLEIDKDFELILDALNKNEIGKEAVFELFLDKAKGKKPDLNQYKRLSDKDVESLIKKIVKEKEGLIKEKGEWSIKIIMGLIMKDYRGKVDSSLVSRLIKEEIQKRLE